jgi:branched-chain amino acid transport system substrate-binding protein
MRGEFLIKKLSASARTKFINHHIVASLQIDTMRGVEKVKYTNAILALLTILLIGCAPATTEKTSEGTKTGTLGEAKELPPVKIGFIGPLTGDNAGLGGDGRAGTELAVKEINNAGGINGRMLEVVYEDGKCNGKDATTAASKLIDVDRVIAIAGGLCSSETLAAAPLAEQAQVALISYASSNPSITNAGDYVFRVWPSDAGQGSAIANEMAKRGIKKVAVIYMNQDYNLGLANAFKQAFESQGGVITAWETYEQDSKDFRSQVAKVRASRPEAVYLVSYSVDGGLLVKQIRDLKLDVPLFGSETLGTKETVEAAGKENIEGLVYATPAFNPDAPKAKELLPKAQQLKGAELSLPVIAADAYDTVYLIAEAIKQNPDNEPTGTIIKDYLYTVKDYDGAGGKLTIDNNGDPLKDFQTMYVHEGNFLVAP